MFLFAYGWSRSVQDSVAVVAANGVSDDFRVDVADCFLVLGGRDDPVFKVRLDEVPTF